MTQAAVSRKGTCSRLCADKERDIMKKITLEELIKNKERIINARKERKTVQLYIESLDGVICVQQPTRETVTDAIGMDKDGDAYMVLNSVIEPNLKDPGLLASLAATDPLDIPNMIFAPGEVSKIAVEAMELAGYSDKSVRRYDELKN